MINEESAKNLIRTAYRQIAIVKEIQRGNLSPTAIALKVKMDCTRQLANYYLKILIK